MIFRQITRTIGQTDLVNDQRVPLVPDEEVSLLIWSQHTSKPPSPSSDILRLPFHFTLPEDPLPSCDYRGSGGYGIVAYAIEVVGKQSGLRLDKKITQPIPVLPCSKMGAQFRDLLRSGWSGHMRMWKEEKKIRRGVWGEYSDAVIYVSRHAALESYVHANVYLGSSS